MAPGPLDTSADAAYERASEKKRKLDDESVPVPATSRVKLSPVSNLPPLMKSTKRDKWYYPDDIANDMQSVPLPREVIEETLACSWEYTRCVIPQFTNWRRYIAFCRIICMGILAEVHGKLVDILETDKVLGYNAQEQLDIVFHGTPGYEDMCREYRCFLLVSSDKCSKRRDSELFRRYVNSIASSAKTWFRMRDCDALARFTMVAAMRCNDQDKTWFSEDEWQILAEIGDTMYDAVAFHKHRAEGETNSTFAYTGSNRADSFKQCREILWALDVAWARDASLRCVLIFLRLFGGPIHLMMRRYRFVEDNLTVGKVETEEVVIQTRENCKLWHRVDANGTYVEDGRYSDIIAQEKRLMFAGMADILDQHGEGSCDDCVYRLSYGAQSSGRFGGVVLCVRCKGEWKLYMESLPERVRAVFPVLGRILDGAGGEGDTE